MQSYPHPSVPEAAIAGVYVVFVLFAVVVGYFLTCFPLYMIGKKLNREDAWWAWVPIINIILMCKVAGKPEWWTILFFVPLVNIVVTVIVWMGISVACGKPDWIGILTLIPVANIVVPFYLAFG